MVESKKERILILAKTYPNRSKKYSIEIILKRKRKVNKNASNRNHD